MKYKAKDIARELGVSPTTVSLVLNNKPGVGEKTREIIINKINELGCEDLLKKGSGQVSHKGYIGFVVYKREGSIVDESPFFNYLLEGMTARAYDNGYILNFIYINSNMSQEEKEAQIKGIDYKGLLVFGVEMIYEDLDVLKKSNLPFVIIDNSFPESDIDAVAINNNLGVSKAVDYLYEMGHRRIGYIKSKVRINSFEERRSAFKRKLRHLRIEEDRKHILNVGYSKSLIQEDVSIYLDSMNKEELPTAFFAENDFLGCNVMRMLQEKGYQVPGDISVIGFDNRPISELVEPRLTTINVPKEIFGPESVALLISKIEEKRQQSLKIVVGTNIIVRESVKRLD